MTEAIEKYKMMTVPKLNEELKNIQKNMSKLGKKMAFSKQKTKPKILEEYEQLQKDEEVIKKLLNPETQFEESTPRSIVPVKSTGVPDKAENVQANAQEDIHDDVPRIAMPKKFKEQKFDIKKSDMDKPVIGMIDLIDDETEPLTEVLNPTREEFLTSRYPELKADDVTKMNLTDIKLELSRMEHLREIVLLDISRPNLDINSRITLAQNLDVIDKNILMLNK